MMRLLRRGELEHPVEPLSASPPHATLTERPQREDPAHLSAAVGLSLLALLGEELRLSPEHVRALVERELFRVRKARRLELHVHPEDLALLETSEEYLARCELSAAPTLCGSPEVERGGCFITSDLGDVDARLETRLRLVLALWRRGMLAP